ELGPTPFNNSNKNKAKKLEAEKILNYLEKHSDSRIFILHEEGENINSRDFARTLERSNGRTIFVVGGSLGFDDSVLEKSWQKLSLSPLTFPHEMARVILLEQIYRAATIIKGKEYHY
ncbi:MAG: 23S rRNA (pseudouridine(1915)-N(3))-methyltransferase RlmH, partial [Patescibacteria group bacterium]